MPKHASEPLISANDLSIVRNQTKILESVSVAIEPHSFTTILGPNGAGKTTLLKALLGLIKPSSGSVHRNENTRIGFVPQRFTAESTLPITARDFILLEHLNAKDSLDAILAKTEAEPFQSRFMHELSGGELQRVLLARALIKKPNLLILDEPAQNLDMSGQLKFYKLLEAIYTDSECAILMVSHDLHLVMASSTHVLCLFNHICCSGTPQQVTKDPAFVSLFGQDVANTMATYQHHHDHEHNH